MTQENLDRLAKLRVERSEKTKQYQIDDLALAKQEHDLYEACDHKYPDGTDAIKGGFLMGVCNICSWSDL